jgi:hypothetical protein
VAIDDGAGLRNTAAIHVEPAKKADFLVSELEKLCWEMPFAGLSRRQRSRYAVNTKLRQIVDRSGLKSYTNLENAEARFGPTGHSRYLIVQALSVTMDGKLYHGWRFQIKGDGIGDRRYLDADELPEVESLLQQPVSEGTAWDYRSRDRITFSRSMSLQTINVFIDCGIADATLVERVVEYMRDTATRWVQ